jgi:glycosyltransferase involved in cell wall biosynthesis
VRIFGWPADFAGCAYYRIHQPLDELGRHGHDVTAKRVALGTADAAMYSADVVVGQRICTPPPSARWAAFRLYKEQRYREWLAASWRSNRDLVQIVKKLDARPASRPKLVFEIDDNLWRVDPSSPQAYEAFAPPEIRRRLAQNAGLADTVTVSTPTLGDVMSQFNRDVRVIPNCIPAALLEHEPPRRTDGVVTIGWAGSHTHAMDWAQVDEHLVRALKKARRTELHVMGGMDPRWSRVPAHRMRVTGWTDSVEDYHRKLDFHIGIAPLKQHPFNLSKSPVKALEYAALGIPVVASDVGPYRDFVKHGETGFLVRRPEEWTRYLLDLVFDEAMREEMGRNARKQASEHTIEATWPLWEEALKP